MTGRVARWRPVARQRATAGTLAWLRTHRRAELALAGRLLAWMWALPTLCLVLSMTGLLLQTLGHDGAALGGAAGVPPARRVWTSRPVMRYS